MKKLLCLAAGLLTLNLTPAFAQPGTLTLGGAVPLRLGASQSELTKFNLDFPGGTPKELVAAIEKAMGKPLNVIIPDEDAATKLPPLNLSEITFAQLSDTLRVGSTKSELVWIRNANGTQYNQMIEMGYYFITTDSSPTDNSVWFFRVTKKPEQPPAPPVEKICRFYSLASYLDRGFTVDDITTAIQTGWKMAGVSPTPELNYHKETKLLIAYGEPDKLITIDDVLKTLPSSNVTVATAAEYAKTLNEAANSLQEARNQIGELKFRMHRLETEMGKSTSATNSVPAEKSGK